MNRLARRRFVQASAASAVVSSGLLAAGAAKGKRPPNIVYFFSDTHRWGALPFTQTPALKTPNMEKMLEQGMCMDRCYSNLPICTPYRAILMTGRWPWQQGLIANHMLLADRVDIPKQSEFGTLGWTFRHAGYQTAYFGKWHLGGNDARPFGWEKSVIWTNTNSHRVKNGIVVDGGKKKNWEGSSNSTATVKQALDWLQNASDKTRPFFIMISVNPPHSNMKDARDDMKELYPDEAALPFHPHDEVKDWEQHQGYHAHISGVDDDLGSVMSVLEKHGLTKNTILVYTSDHGGMGGVRGIGYGSKRFPYDESSRVPFLIQWPGKVPANQRSDALFSSIDIYPTLCALAGVNTVLGKNGKSEVKQTLKYNRECPGVDFSRNLLGQPGGVDPDSVFLMHISNMNNHNPPFPMHHRTIVTKKEMFSVMPQGEFCLFDNAQEYQTENLIRDPKLVAERKALRKKLGEWIARAETPFIENWFKKAAGPKMKSWFGPQGNTIDGTDGIFRLEKITGIAPEDTSDTFTIPGLPPKKKKGGKKKKKA